MSSVLLYSALAGVIGTGFGGIIGVFVGKKSEKIISCILSAAGGIMLSVVFFDLIPEAINVYNNYFVVFLGLIWGVVLLGLLNKFVDKINQKIVVKVNALGVYRFNTGGVSKIETRKLLKSGMFLMFAMALHNIPEGMAIGAINTIESGSGFAIAAVICIHDIPEGMAISLPLSVGKVGKLKSILLSMLAGATTVIGGVLGAWVGGVNPVLSAFFLAFAAGAMLQVTMCEILPDALDLDLSKRPFILALIGIIVGFAFNFFM